MRKYRIPAVIIAVAIGGAGLSACGGGASTPAAGGPSGNGSASLSATATSSGGSAPATGSSSGTPAGSTTAPSSATSQKPVAPATGTAAQPSGTASFTVPAIPGDNVVSAHGTYTKLGTSRVKVTICATQTGTAYAVGALALAYNASGASKNVGAVVLPDAGKTQCGTITFLFYTAHLKVHAFIGKNGNIIKTGPVKTIY